MVQNNNLLIKTRKSKCIVVCTRKRKSVLKYSTINLKLKPDTLECVTELSIRGLCIDYNLCWSLCKIISYVRSIMANKTMYVT